MTEENLTQTDPRIGPALKLPEPDVVSDDPWNDDILGRREIAARLTKLIQHQEAPFVISIDGNWGTGKTFLLKRWQADLQNQGFSAVYFNSWEDDFCDDPLLAILGQMTEHFKEKTELKQLADSVASVAIPLLKRNVISVLEKHTGLVLELESQEQPERDLIAEYLEQRATKGRLRKDLGQLASTVLMETGHPLVFIIDELDRCRPTFAIELLERVKHIFDVPNMLFVFGVNRRELYSALQSVYGEIESNIYLRRFFDMEFSLPEVDSELFCRNLLGRFGFAEFFQSLDKGVTSNARLDEFQLLHNYMPILWGRLGLSLRDMDYCVRMIALVGKSLDPQQSIFPWLLGILIPLKLINTTLYRQFIQGNCHGSEVMNYVENEISLNDSDLASGPTIGLVSILNIIESQLYRAEKQDYGTSEPSSALDQLKLKQDNTPLTHPDYLSKRTQNADIKRITRLIELSSSGSMLDFWDNIIDHTAALIDLHHSARVR